MHHERECPQCGSYADDGTTLSCVNPYCPSTGYGEAYDKDDDQWGDDDFI